MCCRRLVERTPPADTSWVPIDGIEYEVVSTDSDEDAAGDGSEKSAVKAQSSRSTCIVQPGTR